MYNTSALFIISHERQPVDLIVTDIELHIIF